MNAKELEELAEYHKNMAVFAESHRAHHMKMEKSYRERRQRLRDQKNKRIADTKAAEILTKLQKTQ